jgi:hypothetical protein
VQSSCDLRLIDSSHSLHTHICVHNCLYSGLKQALRHSTIPRTHLGTLFLSAHDATSLCTRLPTSRRHKSPLPSSLSGPVRMPGCLVEGNAAHNFSVTVRPPALVQHRDVIPTPSRLPTRQRCNIQYKVPRCH